MTPKRLTEIKTMLSKTFPCPSETIQAREAAKELVEALDEALDQLDYMQRVNIPGQQQLCNTMCEAHAILIDAGVAAVGRQLCDRIRDVVAERDEATKDASTMTRAYNEEVTRRLHATRERDAARDEVERLKDCHPGDGISFCGACVSCLNREIDEARRLHSVVHDCAADSDHMHTMLKHEHTCTVDQINRWRDSSDASRADVERLKTELAEAVKDRNDWVKAHNSACKMRDEAYTIMDGVRPLLNAVEAACDGSVGWRGDWLNVTRAWEKYMAKLPDPDAAKPLPTALDSEANRIALDAEPVVTGLRPSVQAFAERMEASLREHDSDRGERGWIGDSPTDLLDRLKEEVTELQEAILGNGDVLKEASDVGNFAHMIFDLYRPWDKDDSAKPMSDSQPESEAKPEVVDTGSPADVPPEIWEYLSRAYHDRLMREAADRVCTMVQIEGGPGDCGDTAEYSVVLVTEHARYAFWASHKTELSAVRSAEQIKAFIRAAILGEP